MSLDSDSISTTSREFEAILALLKTIPGSRARAARNGCIKNQIKTCVSLLNVKLAAQAILDYCSPFSTLISPSSMSTSYKISGPSSLIRVLPRPQRISFCDLPDDVRFLIYEYTCRGRKNFSTDVATLSPAWKSPQSPAALMNTCSAIAFELMPFYFGGAQFTLDVIRNDLLRNKALDWFAKVGDLHSAHFNNIRVVCGYYKGRTLELEVRVSKQREVTIKETQGHLNDNPVHLPTWKLRKGLIQDLQFKLDDRMKTNSTGFLGGVDFAIIVERVHIYLLTPCKEHGEPLCGSESC